MSFIEAAMAYVVDRNFTYFIGGISYGYSFPSTTPITYCPSRDHATDQGKIIKILNVLYFTYYIFRLANEE